MKITIHDDIHRKTKYDILSPISLKCAVTNRNVPDRREIINLCIYLGKHFPRKDFSVSRPCSQRISASFVIRKK